MRRADSCKFRFGNIDIKYFTEQAMRLSSDPSLMPTTIGTVRCENGVMVERKVGFRDRDAEASQASSWLVRTSTLGWVAVASVALVAVVVAML